MKTKTIRNLMAVALAASAWLAGSGQIFAAGRDDQIEETFKSSQVYRTQLKDADVSIDSDEGVVTLKGKVENENLKNLAAETAGAIPGVQHVNNELMVSQPGAHSDEWIAAEVRASLLLHKNVSLLDTKVSAKNGVVVLTGSAKNEAEKSLAGKYAADVKGVQQVENNIQVVSAQREKSSDAKRSVGEKIDDATITARLKYALGANAATSALRTEVITENGVVTVRGEAKNPAEKDLVTKLAMNIEGVRDVHNEMVVENS